MSLRRRFSCLVFGFAVGCLALLLTPTPARAAETPTVPSPAPAASAGCELDLAALLTTGPSAPAAVCPATVAATEVPEWFDAASRRLGYCHCGCTTARCHTSADCGGAACDPVISCC